MSTTFVVWAMKTPATIRAGADDYIKRPRQWVITQYFSDPDDAYDYADRQNRDTQVLPNGQRPAGC